MENQEQPYEQAIGTENQNSRTSSVRNEGGNIESMQRDGLTAQDINAYSVGHVFNDLCASMWFVYLTWYVNTVVGLSNNVSGLCVLSGQIADGICTPITGFASDRFETRFGKRTPWYAVGTFIVFPCFAGIFMYPDFVNKKIPGTDTVQNKSFQVAWYVTLPALFNVGWAMVQISHMAVVNSLTQSNRRRDKMVNNRNGMTYGANIAVLVTALMTFAIMKNPVDQFRVMCGMCLCVGIFNSIFFLVTIKEKKLSIQCSTLEKLYQKELMGPVAAKEAQKTDQAGAASRNWKGWLSEGTFYVHGVVYMLVRIAVNVTMTVQPFYLQQSLGWKSTKQFPTPIPLAAVPLGSYILSLIFSVWFQSPLTRCLRNRMYPMGLAIVIIVVTSVPLYLLPNDENGSQLRNLVYPCVAVQGIGLAIMLNTATSLISDVIGSDSENSAFVYGVYSLFDKFANGILLYWIVASYADKPEPLRFIISSSPIICSILAFIMTYIGQKFFSHKMAKITGIKLKPKDDELKQMIE